MFIQINSFFQMHLHANLKRKQALFLFQIFLRIKFSTMRNKELKWNWMVVVNGAPFVLHLHSTIYIYMRWWDVHVHSCHICHQRWFLFSIAFFSWVVSIRTKTSINFSNFKLINNAIKTQFLLFSFYVSFILRFTMLLRVEVSTSFVF